MHNLLEIWKQICESNTFNFVVMIILLGWICKKCNIAQAIENGRKKIENSINTSEYLKEKSLTNLYKEQDSVVDVDKEVFELIESAQKNAKNFGEKILDDTKVQVGLIKENCKKSIETNVESTKTNIMTKTAEKALTLAEEQIKQELEKDPNLHLKFINESIDAINEIGVEV